MTRITYSKGLLPGTVVRYDPANRGWGYGNTYTLKDRSEHRDGWNLVEGSYETDANLEKHYVVVSTPAPAKYDVLALIRYLAKDGHKEREALLAHLTTGGYLHCPEATVKAAIKYWLAKNNVCEAGLDRFRAAFPMLVDPAKPKTRKVSITLEVEVLEGFGASTEAIAASATGALRTEAEKNWYKVGGKNPLVNVTHKK